MSLRSWIAFVSWVASIVFIFVGPWDWWVNSLAVGAVWALTFPLRNARREDQPLKKHLAGLELGAWAALVVTMVVQTVVWPVSVPIGGWYLLREIRG